MRVDKDGVRMVRGKVSEGQFKRALVGGYAKYLRLRCRGCGCMSFLSVGLFFLLVCVLVCVCVLGGEERRRKLSLSRSGFLNGCGGGRRGIASNLIIILEG